MGQIRLGETLTEKSRLQIKKTFPEVSQYFVELSIRDRGKVYNVSMYQTDSMYWVLLASEHLLRLEYWDKMSNEEKQVMYDMFYFLEYNYGRGFLVAQKQETYKIIGLYDAIIKYHIVQTLIVFSMQLGVYLVLMMLLFMSTRRVYRGCAASSAIFGMVDKDEVCVIIDRLHLFIESYVTDDDIGGHLDVVRDEKEVEGRYDVESWEKGSSLPNKDTLVQKLSHVDIEQPLHDDNITHGKLQYQYLRKPTMVGSEEPVNRFPQTKQMKYKKVVMNREKSIEKKQKIFTNKAKFSKTTSKGQKSLGLTDTNDNKEENNESRYKSILSDLSKQSPLIMRRIVVGSVLVLATQLSIILMDFLLQYEYAKCKEFVLATMELRNGQYTLNTILLDYIAEAKYYPVLDPLDTSKQVDLLAYNIAFQNDMMRKITAFKESDLPGYMSDYYKLYLKYQQDNVCKLGMIKFNRYFAPRSLLLSYRMRPRECFPWRVHSGCRHAQQ